MNFLSELSYSNVSYDGQRVKDLLEESKVIVLRNFDDEVSKIDFFESFTDSIGYIYPIDEDLKSGKSTGKRWIDITYDPDIIDRYRSAPVAQPLHTDASYVNIHENVQFFYCVSQADFGGATVFIDANRVVELLKFEKEKQLLDDLMNVSVHFQKDKRSKFTTILRKKGDDYHFNWNYHCGAEDNPSEVKRLFESFHAFLERRIVRSGLLTEILLRKNDMVLFHDELVLHGRNSYFAKEKGGRSLNKGTVILESKFHKNRHIME